MVTVNRYLKVCVCLVCVRVRVCVCVCVRLTACNCNGKSSECYFDPELYRASGHGGHCRGCADNTDGPNCERCLDDYYRDQSGDRCLPCGCSPVGEFPRLSSPASPALTLSHVPHSLSSTHSLLLSPLLHSDTHKFILSLTQANTLSPRVRGLEL